MNGGSGFCYYDEQSEKLHLETLSFAGEPARGRRVTLNVGRFEVRQSYVTARVVNRHGDAVGINIEGGRSGIDLQETLFKLDDDDSRHCAGPKFAYVLACVGDKLLVRKLPVLGVKDWLLIYDDDLFLLAVKDAYEEVEIVLR
jgi:hypothetical protein